MTTSEWNRRGARAFTLIEMLVVIAIIGLLAALLLPAIQGALRKAEAGKASTTAVQLATALRNFKSEYGTWPNSTAGDQNMTMVMVNTLTGQDSTTNPRGLVFLEVEAKSLASSGYVDPWGNVYRFRVDQSYAGSLTTPDGLTVPADCVVWSLGPKGTAATSKDWIKTW